MSSGFTSPSSGMCLQIIISFVTEPKSLLETFVTHASAVKNSGSLCLVSDKLFSLTVAIKSSKKLGLF